MVTRVDKFLGGLGADVTNVANVHATENRIAFGASMNPTANVHVTGNAHITTTLSTGGNIIGGGTYTGGGTMTTGGNIVIPNDGDVGSVGATDAIQISSDGIVTFKDDIKIKDGGTIGSASDAAAITIAASGQVTFSDVATFSGGLKVPDDGDIGSASATDAMQISSGGIVTFKDDIKIKDGGTIGSATTPAAITVASDGIVTFADDIKIKDAGTIGSASAPTAIGIASDGIVTFVDDIKIKDGGTIGSATTPAAITVASDGKATLVDDLAVTGNNIVTLGLGLAGNTAPVATTLSLGTPANVVVRTHAASGAGNVIIGDATAISSHNLDVRGTANTGAITATTITLSADGGVIVPNDGNIGSAGSTAAMQISSGGIVTFADDIKIKDAGTIGSASDPDAIAIGADGDVTLTQDLELQHDGAIISFGTNDEITLTHVHDTGLLLNDTGGSPTLQLHDSDESVSSDGSKLILTSNGVAFNMPTVDGDADQVLTTDGSGTLSFAAAASGANDPSVNLASNIDLGNLTDATIDAFGQGITVINDLLDMPFETTLATLDLGAL